MMRSSRSPVAVTASLTAHIKAEATRTGVPFDRVKRRFVMSRFLERVFTADPDGWILKGGVGMMIRLPQARHSRDIDMMRMPRDDGHDGRAVDELQQLVHSNSIDPLAFDITSTRTMAADKGLRITVAARLGLKTFDSFPIDLAAWQGVVGEVEHHALSQIPDLDDFPVSATIRLYPLADQIADKLCAMYEQHALPDGRKVASSRYRDLVDLLLISGNLAISMTSTVAALEKQRAHRNILLPNAFQVPGAGWSSNWSATAKESPLAAELHDLTTALDIGGRCYGRILAALPAGRQPPDTWNPRLSRWTS
ncbi:nucleotidyl transferase AbiEii/AbiGii toxin family protein [Antrihabitans spumae]|uniref:Nucleotidyl transferase AbiEii/AbiGii toxin family protein n=1 Tax=Antrihabitans spumae TaxID=3373370 RepID=A0ABW7KD64_9NOCA